MTHDNMIFVSAKAWNPFSTSQQKGGLRPVALGANIDPSIKPFLRDNRLLIIVHIQAREYVFLGADSPRTCTIYLVLDLNR